MNENNLETQENQGFTKKKIKKGYIIGGAIAVVLIALILINPFMKFHTQKIELGNQVSNNIADYVNFYDTGLFKSASLDTSAVNTMKVGDYEARVKAGIFTFKYKIKVVDTTPPEIQLKDKAYAAIDRPIDPATLIAGATDLSGEIQITIDGKSEYTPTQLGEDTLTVKATDASGNSSTANILFTVEYPPIIVGAFDNSVKLGSDYKPTDYIVASDKNEGNLNKKLQADLGGFNIDIPGEYHFKFSVTNSHEITTTADCVCTVLADMGSLETRYLSTDDINQLIDYNYFKYQPLENADRDAAAEMVAPTLLNLYGDHLIVSGYTGAYSGSGVIYSIDSEYIYVSTNKHVAVGFPKWTDRMDIFLYNGERISLGYIPDYKEIDGVDIAMFRIPIDKIPQRSILMLRQVYVEEKLDEQMPSGSDIFYYAPQWKGGTQVKLVNAKMISYSELSANDLAAVNRFGNPEENYFLTTSASVHGMSGTGIFDFYGRFVGSCSAGCVNMERGNIDVSVDNEFQLQLYDMVKAG